MLRKLTRWLRHRIRPGSQGFPLARVYLCMVCQEISDGRQSKCLAAHTHKIVPLAAHLARQQHRISHLWQKWLEQRRVLRAAAGPSPRPRQKIHNPALYLTKREP